METEEVIEWLNKGDVISDDESKIKFDQAREASIRSLKAWEQVKIKLHTKAIDCALKGDKHGEHCFSEALKIIDLES